MENLRICECSINATFPASIWATRYQVHFPFIIRYRHVLLTAIVRAHSKVIYQLTKMMRIRTNLSVPRCSPLVEEVDSAADADVEHDEDGHGGEARRRQGVKLEGGSEIF